MLLRRVVRNAAILVNRRLWVARRRNTRQKRVPTDRALRKAGARLDRAATIVSTRGAGMQMGGDGVRGYHADDPDRGDR